MAKQTIDDIPFTQVANVVLNDKKLSMRAKGLYSYLYSKPQNWDFSSDRIKDDFTDGKRAILATLKELEKSGYLQRIKRSNGRVDYHLVYSQSAQTALWVEEPECGFSNVHKPHSAQTAPISNKESTSNKENIYSWEKTRDKMMEKVGSDMDIIATYLVEKKIVPKTSDELTGYIKRYRKIAAEIKPFVGSDFKRFWQAVEICKEESHRLGYDWKLETIYKKITNIK